jgi:AraC-like DNA-binding protein
MLLQQAFPGPRLDRWIHSYRRYTFTPDDGRQFICLPGTGAELWLQNSGQLANSRGQLGDGLLCLRSCPLLFRQAGLQLFSIRFRAGALPFFTDLPLTRLIDHFTPITTPWDETASAPLKSMQRSPHFDEQCLLAERFLLSRRRTGGRLEQMQKLATVIYEQSADFALGDYAGVMQRNRSALSRQFHETQGTSAKHFHRLCRFERFLRDALFSAAPSLAGLAVDHGYYDQAHMHHEVRQISQQTPRRLLERDESRLFYSQRPGPG